MSKLFRDPAGRDIDSAIWFSPVGPLLVCLSDSVGFDLFSREEWDACSEPALKANEQGEVFLHERPTGWRVPPEIRAKAIH